MQCVPIKRSHPSPDRMTQANIDQNGGDFKTNVYELVSWKLYYVLALDAEIL